ncbi:L,D-transpeptidase family protein [Phosphitispora sp. TUW77]|uniref:L,D-transpeptidase family protein n=1 Tax=Phosphitispora sp. TUW77 TaxID=3152361 RepID=UPI003AB79FC0
MFKNYLLGLIFVFVILGQPENVYANAGIKEVPKGSVELLISVDKQTLTVYDDKKEFKVYHVAVGKNETPTPVGIWQIKRKAKNWGTGFGSRWMGLNVPWGIYGIHGTNKPWSIGSRASHGCIRMLNRDVEELYEWVELGTVVRIDGKIYPAQYEYRDKVHRGHKGSVVMEVQKGLIREGYLKGPVDGIFGGGTEAALKQLQKDRGFEVTGQVDIDIWGVLGL